MMDESERSTWRALLDRVTVYRGCSEINVDGFSWSLSRDIAAKYPMMHRYKPAAGPRPLLVTVTVPKRRFTAVKLDRSEQEVITLHARELAREHRKNST